MNQDFAIGLHIMGFLTASDGHRVSSSSMAKSFGTSAVVLRRILARLNHAGLVDTKRGSNGGSTLAHPATQINLKAVYDAVCPNPELFIRHPQGEDVISNILGQYINDIHRTAEQAMFAQLESTSVADMDQVVRPQIIAALRCDTKKS